MCIIVVAQRKAKTRVSTRPVCSTLAVRLDPLVLGHRSVADDGSRIFVLD
jgi:hypothetical protein